MEYLVYLRRSLRRRPARHLTILLIMTCALVLPLLFSIYLDSSEYGECQQLISWTKGETFHINNAREEDCAIFADKKKIKAQTNPVKWDKIFDQTLCSRRMYLMFTGLGAYCRMPQLAVVAILQQPGCSPLCNQISKIPIPAALKQKLASL